MSTTNRAFIKAYRQDSADPSPTAGNTPAILGQDGNTVRDAAVRTTTASAAPHTATGTQSATSKRPLSSYITRPHVDATAPSPPVRGPGEGALAPSTDTANILHPGTTVASFQWPKICRTLCLQSGTQLDRVVDLCRAQAKTGHSLIGIMGLFPRVGATTTALCLAARAAQRVDRTILADGNFHHPRIAAWLDAAATFGWEDVLKSSAPLADAVIRATDDKLDLLALGAKASRDPLHLAASLQAAVTAGVLRHAYELTLIDLGTFFDPTSQPIVLELVRNMGIDAVVAVTGPEPADPRDLATIAEYFAPSDCQLLGTIENRVAKQAT